MRPEILDRLNNLHYEMKALADELRLDPARDAQFACRMLSQTIAGMDMHLSNMYGVKTQAKQLEVPVAVEEPPKPNLYEMAGGKAKKAPKKNSPV